MDNRLLNYFDDDIYFHLAYDNNPQQKDYILHTNSTQFTIFYLIQGQGSYMVEGYEYTYQPDSIIIMRPNEVRKHTVNSSYAFKRVLFYFSEKILDYIDPDKRLLAPFLDRPLGVNNQYLNHEFKYDINKFIHHICEKRTEDAYFRTTILAALNPILIDLYEAFQIKKNSPQTRIPLPAQIIKYVNDNIFNDLSMSDITARFYISNTQLWRIFKNSTGYSPNNYIQLKRVNEARRLIKSGVPVNKAAVTCGYHDYSTFFRAYKKHFHLPPTGNDDTKEFNL